MAKTKNASGRTSKGGSGRSKAPKTPRGSGKQSNATRMRKLSRELEKVQKNKDAYVSRENEIREQMMKVRGDCPHQRIAIDPNTRNIYCRDCLDIVGIAPSQMMGGDEE